MSLSAGSGPEDDPVPVVPAGPGEILNDPIAQEFKEIMMENEVLAKENRLFHAYLHRHLGSVREDDVDSIQPMAPAGHVVADNISLQLKYSMALQEQEFRARQLHDLNNRVTEDINLLKAISESIRIRISDLRKESYEFQRNVVVRGENPRSGTVMSDVVLDHWGEKIKGKRAAATLLLQKAAALAEHRAKLETKMRLRETQGDHLLAIDLHQLQIRNQQHNQRVRDLTSELFTVKSSAVRTVQVLNARKRELKELMQASDSLRSLINERQGGMQRLKSELEGVEEELRQEQAVHRRLRMQQANPDIPHVLDYVKQKAELHELQAELRNWSRKVEIVTLAAARAKALLKRARQERTERAQSIRKALQNGGGMFLPPLQ